jgi:hypothetical protein
MIPGVALNVAGLGAAKRRRSSQACRRAAGSKPRPDGLLWANAPVCAKGDLGLDLLKMSMPVRTRLLDICWTSNQVIQISY